MHVQHGRIPLWKVYLLNMNRVMGQNGNLWLLRILYSGMASRELAYRRRLRNMLICVLLAPYNSPMWDIGLKPLIYNLHLGVGDREETPSKYLKVHGLVYIKKEPMRRRHISPMIYNWWDLTCHSALLSSGDIRMRKVSSLPAFAIY